MICKTKRLVRTLISDKMLVFTSCDGPGLVTDIFGSHPNTQIFLSLLTDNQNKQRLRLVDTFPENRKVELCLVFSYHIIILNWNNFDTFLKYWSLFGSLYFLSTTRNKNKMVFFYTRLICSDSGQTDSFLYIWIPEIESEI